MTAGNIHRTLVLLLATLCCSLPGAAQQKPWPVKIVILTAFEIGADTGDRAGEFQHWVEGEHLTEMIDFPAGLHPIRANKDHTVIGIVMGMWLNNATASVMGLGLDPRFDLSHAYWLVAGTAGVDPHAASLASVAWANYVVGDANRFVDPKDAPKDWPYGWFANGTSAPNEPPKKRDVYDQMNLYELNPALVQFAYGLTKDLKLPDTRDIKAAREAYVGLPNAQRPPFVLIGATFAQEYFWSGPTATLYAQDWVKMWTNGKGTFVMTENEDTGVMQALQRLNKMHKADFQRVMDLRAGSNFCMPPPGRPTMESTIGEPVNGLEPAVAAAYLAGSTVVHALLADWAKYGPRAPEQ